jgi:hypothetical protein
VEYGIHKDTQSPLVVDPFAREDGYAMFTVGDPGSGKSCSGKQNFIRSIECPVGVRGRRGGLGTLTSTGC